MTFSAGIFNGACVHPMYLKSILSKIIESSENCVLVHVSYMLSMPANFTLAPQKSIKCHSHTHIFCAFLISRTQYLWCVVLCTLHAKNNSTVHSNVHMLHAILCMCTEMQIHMCECCSLIEHTKELAYNTAKIPTSHTQLETKTCI